MPLRKLASFALKLIVATTLATVITMVALHVSFESGWYSPPAVRKYFNPNLLAVGGVLLVLSVCAYAFRIRGLRAPAFVLIGFLLSIPLYLLIGVAVYQPD